jgi:hypothetical protein
MKTGLMATTGITVLLMAACGGGGGGGDDDAPAPVEPLEATVIEASNAMDVAFSVLGPIELLGLFSSDDGILPLALSETPLTSTNKTLYKNVSELIHWPSGFLTAAEGGSLIQAVAVELPPETQPCLVSGSVTVSASFADDTQQYLSPGDVITSSFQQCDNGDGVVINGGFRILILTRTAIDLDINLVPPYTFGRRISFSNLSLSEPGETTTLSGDLELEEATEDAVVYESHVATDQLTTVINGDRETLRDFQLSGVVNEGNGSYSVEVLCEAGRCPRIESDYLNGYVDFGSLSPFEGISDDDPYTGILEAVGGVAVDGLGPSRLETEALTPGCVELRLDENGDGGTDWTQRTTWTSLPTGIVDPC